MTMDEIMARVTFPLDRGQRRAKATFTILGRLTSTDAFTDVTVFNIRPAQCDASLSGRDCSGYVGYGNLRHQPGVWGRNGVRRADVHLLWDREP